jgi:serine protease Do
VEVTVGELPERPPAVAAVRAPPDTPGVSVASLTPEVARRLGLPPTVRGAVVAEVRPGGLAAEAGLRPGDVVTEVNHQPVRGAEDFARAVEQARGQDLAVRVERGGSARYVVLEGRR